MKPLLAYTLLILLGLVLTSCQSYSTAPVAAHASGGAIVGSGPTASVVPSTSSRHIAEAQKANAFYKVQ